MSKTCKALLVAALLSFSAIANASPLIDLSSTSVGVSEQDTSPTTHVYTVSVQRVDDLLSDDGVFLAERVMSVTMNFDVDDEKILVNSIPVPLGVSTIEVEAAIEVGPSLASSQESQETIEETLEVLNDAFDVGLVTVEIAASAEIIAQENTSFRRVFIRERVVEVNGQSVIQTDIGQQIFDVLEDGRVVGYGGDSWPEDVSPYLMPGIAMDPEQSNDFQGMTQDIPYDLDDEEPMQPHGPCSFRHKHRLLRWWKHQPMVIRVAISSILGATVFALAFFIVPGLFRIIFGKKESEYEPVDVVESDDIKVIPVDIDDEKKALMAQQ